MANTSFKTFSNQELEQVLHAILGRQPEPRPERENTALVIIDMQYVDAHPDYGLGAREKELGLAGSLDYYWSRLGESVVPNIQRLLATARRTGVEVVHVKVRLRDPGRQGQYATLQGAEGQVRRNPRTPGQQRRSNSAGGEARG